MKIGFGICGIHVKSFIVDEVIIVKISPFIRLRADSFKLAYTILISCL